MYTPKKNVRMITKWRHYFFSFQYFFFGKKKMTNEE